MTELDALRNEMDTLDEELITLFCRRMELSGRIADVKRQAGLPIRDEAREAEKLLALERLTPEALRADTRCLYELLFDLSRAHQARHL